MDPKPPQAPIKRELSPEEKIIVKSFEQIPFCNAIINKLRMDLILTWRNLKSATNLHLKGDATDEDVRRTKEIIEKAGLYFLDSGVVEKNGTETYRTCFVANNKKDLELIAKLWFLENREYNPWAYKEIGRMSGFPGTAIELFDEIHKAGNRSQAVQEELALTEEDKKRLFPKELYLVSTRFLMSKKNWRTELKTARRWANEIKLVDPKLYQNILSGKL